MKRKIFVQIPGYLIEEFDSIRRVDVDPRDNVLIYDESNGYGDLIVNANLLGIGDLLVIGDIPYEIIEIKDPWEGKEWKAEKEGEQEVLSLPDKTGKSEGHKSDRSGIRLESES